ncbi:MAG: hypothetical protein V4702_00955 [Patescibacteria group bacterium]
MANCPTGATKFNCAYFAAAELTDNELIDVDFSVIPPDAEVRSGLINPEVFFVLPVESEELGEVMRIGCVSCGNCIQIVEDCSIGGLYPKIG